MKHIFYIHSNITFLITKKYIEKCKIKDRNLIFILDRNFHHSYFENKRTLDFSKFIIQDGSFKYSIENKNLINKYTLIFSNQIDSEYYCYIPHFKLSSFNLLVKNKFCKGFYIVEEGLLAYTKKEVVTRSRHFELKTPYAKWYLKLFIKSLGTNLPKPYIKSKHDQLKGFICTSKFSYEGFHNRILVDSLFQLETKLNDKIVYVLTNMFYDKMKEHERVRYFEKIKKSVNWAYLKFNTQISLKFHPSIYKTPAVKKEILGYLKTEIPKIDIESLPNDYSLEELAANSNSVFIGSHSSVLIYAILNNCEVYSDYYLFHTDNKFWNNFSSELIERLKFIIYE